MRSFKNFIPADERRISELLQKDYAVRVVPETGSTNSDLLSSLRSGETSPAVLAAHMQSSGKGRLGRSFDSEPGGIYFSFTPPSSLPPDSARWLTPLAGVAAAETLRSIFGLDVKIKWVNDLYLDGKKLAGILAESFFDGETLRAAVGIGINGVNTRFPETATSLSLHTQKIIDASAVIGGVVSRFCGRLPEAEGIAEEYRALSCLTGKIVAVHAFDGSRDYLARALDIDDGCALIVRTEGGVVRRLVSGEVSVKEAAAEDFSE